MRLYVKKEKKGWKIFMNKRDKIQHTHTTEKEKKKGLKD